MASVKSKRKARSRRTKTHGRLYSWLLLLGVLLVIGFGGWKIWSSDTVQMRFVYMWDYQQDIVTYSKKNNVDPFLVAAIIKNESNFKHDAVSKVGAVGLMQIMPGTATHTVKMFSIPGYSSPGQLLDPETNINIGTSYLQYVYQQFGNNRIFSSAAYNAGPGRVRTWLGNSAGRIDAVAFVESIPFSETRGYVKNVLAYDAYYRYFMGDKPTLMSATEWGRRY